jgi:hypothetical protein
MHAVLLKADGKDVVKKSSGRKGRHALTAAAIFAWQHAPVLLADAHVARRPPFIVRVVHQVPSQHWRTDRACGCRQDGERPTVIPASPFCNRVPGPTQACAKRCP